MRRTVLVMLGALAIVALAACGSDDGKVSIDTPEGKVEVDPNADGDGGSVEFSGPDGDGGSIDIGGGEVPDDFPDDIPLPDDFEVTTSFSGGSGTDNATSVTGSSGDSFDDLVSMYTDGLPDSGYEVTGNSTSTINGAETAVITFEGNGITGGGITVSSEDVVNPDSDRRALSISYGAGG